ncbi:uncharacterized protein OCT59_009313 [Rhizophagus irregularis]|uniref:Uncharacterized protein n=1 Tax=Rhizophagus irregularis (strain DAOM 181602 / DAOM 197198 / MUCL 43194) TaxID=747089 RepID=A0A2P4PN52_RHIID|nr:hypothetical protein GLOIN_2v1653903 [Rhizophagus irregularis DAOM 181602=DAOM 197198]POG66821.1 hypothetical protein GLOIN_2v1653903 [Rhizophagus irregularis DAOM 181602=DAOM 197198]UZO17985.1 hypothetical protein OCT59_009313 [Rhizophagus irregularis]|eukprot:XP_025173687.1 hypothetical protein GLOIN_2v1653903 [Rhizophagus irregularis DAOM 181602=DAOM 197198]
MYYMGYLLKLKLVKYFSSLTFAILFSLFSYIIFPIFSCDFIFCSTFFISIFAVFLIIEL